MMQMLRRLSVVVTAVLLAITQPQTAAAALLGVTIDIPVITFNNTGTLDYDATTDLLAIDAIPFLYKDPVENPFFFSDDPFGTVTIDIEVNSTGVLVGGISGDDLVVTGDVDTYSGTLLTADVSQFGYFDNDTAPDLGTDSFDFLFTITGGALATEFGGIGADLAVEIFSESSDFAGVFTTDFSGEAKGSMGPPPEPPTIVPVPAAVWLFGSGLLGLVGIARRKRVS
jgi:hypothetical protein